MLGVMVMIGASKAVVKVYGCAPHMYCIDSKIKPKMPNDITVATPRGAGNYQRSLMDDAVCESPPSPSNPAIPTRLPESTATTTVL